MTRVWDYSRQSGSSLLVLLALADFANDQGTCWPSVSTVADKARISERHAQRILRELVQSGELVCLPNEGPKGANLYVVENVSTPDKMSPPGDIGVAGGVTSATKGGDIHVTRTVIEPSIEPSSNPPSSPRGKPEAGATENLPIFGPETGRTAARNDPADRACDEPEQKPGHHEGVFAEHPERADRPKTAPDGRHHEITARWGERFREACGFDYAFNGRDAAALKRFLAGSRETADGFLETARGAWERSKSDRFARSCRMAATIHGLCIAYNDVRMELARGEATRREEPNYTGLGRLGIAVMP